MAKKTAKNNLDDLVAKGDNIKKTNVAYQQVNKNMADASSKLKNVDKHLPGNINNKVNDAINNLDTLNIENNSLLKRRGEQNFMQNLFDSESRKAKRVVGSAENSLDRLKKTQNIERQKVTNNLNVQMDKSKADMKRLEDTIGITQLNSNVADAQAAYDKATRNTSRARTAVIGGAIGSGLVAKKLSDNKSNNSQFYYQPNLNNNF